MMCFVNGSGQGCGDACDVEESEATRKTSGRTAVSSSKKTLGPKRLADWVEKERRKKEREKRVCVCEAGRYYAIDEASAEQGEKRTINKNKNQMSSWWHLIVQSDSRGSGTQRK